MKHLKPEQVAALIEAAGSIAKTPELADRNRLLLRVVFEHGMRISEALALTKGSMQRGGYMRVRARKKGKHSDEKASPQVLDLWAKVTANMLPNTLIFRGISREWVSAGIFHRAASAARIELQPRMGIHCLRHSLGHAMLDSGASSPAIQKALRHRSLSSTSCYLEADSADVDQARAKAIGGACEAVAQPSVDELRREIERLSKLLALQADAPQPAPTSGDFDESFGNSLAETEEVTQ